MPKKTSGLPHPSLCSEAEWNAYADVVIELSGTHCSTAYVLDKKTGEVWGKSTKKGNISSKEIKSITGVSNSTGSLVMGGHSYNAVNCLQLCAVGRTFVFERTAEGAHYQVVIQRTSKANIVGWGGLHAKMPTKITTGVQEIAAILNSAGF